MPENKPKLLPPTTRELKVGDKVKLHPSDCSGRTGTITELAHGYEGIDKYYFLKLDEPLHISSGLLYRVGRSIRELILIEEGDDQ